MKQKDINIGDKFGIYEVLGELQRTKTTQPRRFLVKCEVCGAENLSINKDNLLRCPTHCQPRNHHYLKEEEIILYSPDFEIERKQRDFNRRQLTSKLASIDENTWQKLIDVSTSYADLLRRIGKRDGRQDYGALKTFLRQFPNLDFSQMKENAKKKERINELPFGEVFKKGTHYSSSVLRNKLIKAGIKTFEKCEECGITEWNGKPIVIQLHHKDGDNTNNEIDNIAELCPNCHSQTENYSKRKNRTIVKDTKDFDYSSHLEAPIISQKTIINSFSNELTFKEENLKKDSFCLPIIKEHKKYFCFDCGKEISRGSIRCLECDKKRNQNLSKCPSKEELEKEIPNHSSMVSLAKKYGVSDNTVRKWLKKLEIENKPVPTENNTFPTSRESFSVNKMKKTLSQWEIYLNIDRGFLVKYRRSHDKESTRNFIQKTLDNQ